MTAFLISLAILIGGYFIYGLAVDRLLRTDASRPMPAITRRDDIDYRPLPTWRVFLIQFLNIAGLGPIFGAIMGIMFGPAAFLWIALGTIFAGGVHDFCSGVISLRSDGASLPEIIGTHLGQGVKMVIRVFSVLLLVLVTTVFIVTPAGLLATLTPESLNSQFWVLAILAYYVLATLLPIDKLIGNIYPVFGFALLFMAVGILAVLIVGDVEMPVTFRDSFTSHNPSGYPVFPMMFVSIACGAISGFHATQSPMMARCMKNERLARPVFYGAMVAEGIVALIWAAATITFTKGYDGLAEYMAQPGHSPSSLIHDISTSWLGAVGGIIAVIGVIAAPITTGDTALRSARLIVADFTRFKQDKIWQRALVSIPLFILTYLVMTIDFNVLWRYFAWSNQTMAVFTLWASTVYLARHGRLYIITLVPAMFMTMVCTSYILVAPSPEGFGIGYSLSLGFGAMATVVLTALFARYLRSLPPVAMRPAAS